MLSKIILMMLLLVNKNTIVIDRMAAVVNNEIITISDIDKAISFYPVWQKNEESTIHFYLRVLDDLITYKIVYLEFRNDFTLQEDDYETVQLLVIKKIGSWEKLLTQLKKMHMNLKDFKDYITEKVLYEKVLQNKLQETIIVPFQEIEDFYRQDYLPMQTRLNLEPQSLVDMTEIIEKHLKKQKIEKILSQWLNELKATYKIEIILTEEPQ